MRKKSWQWDHFYQGEKVNSTHYKGYCNYCIAFKLTIVEVNETKALLNGSITAKRGQDLLLMDGEAISLIFDVDYMILRLLPSTRDGDIYDREVRYSQ